MSRERDSSALRADAPLPVVRDVAALRRRLGEFRQAGETIALVPTMGALHEGHLALVRRARAACGHVVATLFVNPKQFDRAQDLQHYPRSEARDADLLAREGCSLLYAPTVAEMYPDDFATTISIAGLTGMMEGAHRPGHFDGVATVVAKLLLQSMPDIAFFGEKDYQQLQTIRRMVLDLDIPVAIEGVATVREPDGLALSSRNRNLTPAERRTAPLLARTLHDVAARLAGGDLDAGPVLQEGRDTLLRGGFDRVDYLELRDAQGLEELRRADRPARLLAAAWLGATRLIDNLPVD